MKLARKLDEVGRWYVAIGNEFGLSLSRLSKADWATQLRSAHARRNREMGVAESWSAEFFRVTAWGTVPAPEQLVTDFPNLINLPATRARLRERLSRWSGA